VIGYADTRIKDSPDGVTHWCPRPTNDLFVCSVERILKRPFLPLPRSPCRVHGARTR
jgi:hypothetical protein